MTKHLRRKLTQMHLYLWTRVTIEAAKRWTPTPIADLLLSRAIMAPRRGVFVLTLRWQRTWFRVLRRQTQHKVRLVSHSQPRRICFWTRESWTQLKTNLQHWMIIIAIIWLQSKRKALRWSRNHKLIRCSICRCNNPLQWSLRHPEFLQSKLRPYSHRLTIAASRSTF